jgi:hypothetical protein
MDTPVEDAGSEAGVGFFSDDDLPEWLRSLSPAAAPSGATVDPIDVVMRPASSSLTIPSVSRVWVTPHDAAPVPASTALFASVASALDERPDVLVSETPADASLPVSSMPFDQPMAEPAATPVSVVRPKDRRWSRKVLWLTVTFIILAVVMLAILMQLQNS